MANDQSNSLGVRLVKLFDPSYDLTGKDTSGKQLNTEAGRKVMDEQFKIESDKAKRLSGRTLGGQKKAAQRKSAWTGARKRG
jgi:hypothetical protein